MIYLKPHFNQNSNSGNSYLKHFQIANKNLMMVLQEQKGKIQRKKHYEKIQQRLS